ncbi:hypothetical protein BBD42_25240 [Paenibacillus sp. BIHB 4019]|uniref:HAD family hydrolase n=1 Tax=Paenibacillus sp. BIHB 4019 TaxID=1870819 RepID=A0A1B2DNY3_9BACL|nr:HAD family hydrolase [Paenibacillus sp. BIHB 4019]ANY69418.1 hypothetical protein BBD42_25240 [Paenibacillus sp. BIHB 4019]
MIKLIVSDLDGTLMNHARQIEKRDLDAIESALNEDLELCIASGRMYSEIKMIMQQLTERYYAIGQNGATVYNKEIELLASYVFEPEVSSRVLQTTRSFEQFVNFIHCTDDTFYIRKRTEASLSYENRILTACTERGDVETALANNEMRCSKISFFGELNHLMQMKNELNDLFTGAIETFISDKDCLDVMPLNVSKGVGLSLLMSKLGLHPSEVACIGDSFNDLSMFAITEHSYAMSSSHAEIKQKASYTVQSVAEAIDHILTYNRSLQQ